MPRFIKSIFGLLIITALVSGHTGNPNNEQSMKTDQVEKRGLVLVDNGGGALGPLAPPEVEEGKCGPNNGGVACNGNGDYQYCDEARGECGATQAHKTAAVQGYWNYRNAYIKEDIQGTECYTGTGAALQKACSDNRESMCCLGDACLNWTGENTVCASGRCGPGYALGKCDGVGNNQYCDETSGECGATQAHKTAAVQGLWNSQDAYIKEDISGTQCYTGTGAALQKACSDNRASMCCLGDACLNWSGENTVCAKGRCGSGYAEAKCDGVGDNQYCLDSSGECGSEQRHKSGSVPKYNSEYPYYISTINGAQCYTGGFVAVNKACVLWGEHCCNDRAGNSCTSWSGENTVCDGACTRANSCSSFGQDNKILAGACTKDNECMHLGDGNTVEQIDAKRCYTGSADTVAHSCDTVADSNCCTGNRPCDDWDGDNTVCVGSCTGDEACLDLGKNTRILADSCKGIAACKRLGGDTISPGLKQVGPSSCTGDQACELVGTQSAEGMNTAYDIHVGSNSCNGVTACYEFGERASMVDIPRNSCNADGVCYYGSAACEDELAYLKEPGACRESTMACTNWFSSGAVCKSLPCSPS